MKPFKCPEHHIIMIGNGTKYGERFACPKAGCDYVAWVAENGAKSKPANRETRKARIEAHEVLDSLWKNRKFHRHLIYKSLAAFLERNPKKTHIRLFDLETCRKVHDFVKLF